MKRRTPRDLVVPIWVSLVLCGLLLLAGCANDRPAGLTERDKEQISEVAAAYYNALVDEQYMTAFGTLSESQDFIDVDARVTVLHELRDALGYRISWSGPIKAGDVSYHEEMGMPFMYTVLSLQYGAVSGDINEVLFFKRDELDGGAWKIAHIESLDRYIPYRAADYTLNRIPDFLMPQQGESDSNS
ncbi:hypothetical protein IDH44_12835 [Paenibacillus sp. IB182496]|uniref:Uncharacterized protein n=1 Tax=Paenibacillus sabuli TaxID=2772509 RepID=A0A927BVF2_9BACL|nr:hypothetical protein [Paenibacillus sabuli]MBD2846083.1 hypothetical protein [Paenibacillus sabuli]